MGALIRRTILVMPMAFAVAAIACHGDSVVSPTATASNVTLEAVTSLQVDGIVEQPVAQTPTVIVKDLLGHPVAGITVNFNDPTGSVSAPSVITGPSGIASPGQWTPGYRPGKSILSVRIDGAVRLTFTATTHPDVPVSLRAMSDTDNVQLAGAPITSVSILVQDKHGNGIPGVGVSFSLIGSGSLSQPSSVTVDNGVAMLSTWTPGPAAGLYGVVARVAGLDSIRFKARVLDPTTLEWYSLESMIVNGKPLPISDEYVANADLALSDDGYYIEDIAWTYTAAESHNGGRYTHPDANLSITFSKTGESAMVAGDSLLIGRRDLDDGFPVTWLYRLRAK